MHRRLSALAALAVVAALALPAPSIAQGWERTKVGSLTCDISAGIGLIITSKKELTCMFTPSQPGPREVYTGSITKFGLDLGATAGGEMIWAATMQLANFGAEVVKIEEPERGDYGRWIPPYLNGEGAVFHMVNRGKKSVALDLKSDSGREAFLKLAQTADVVVESFRPGTMQRLGLSYETLHASNERL